MERSPNFRVAGPTSWTNSDTTPRRSSLSIMVIGILCTPETGVTITNCPGRAWEAIKGAEMSIFLMPWAMTCLWTILYISNSCSFDQKFCFQDFIAKTHGDCLGIDGLQTLQDRRHDIFHVIHR